MMRITSGFCKGLTLKLPRDVNLRPTKSKARQAFLNIIQADLEGAMMADLFSGTGAVGIEAVSRGAKGCVFVEQNKKLARHIELMIEEVERRASKQSIEVKTLAVINKDVFKCWHDLKKWGPYNIIWIDSPYQMVGSLKNLPEIVGPFLAKDALIAIESNREGKDSLMAAYQQQDQFSLRQLKNYGYTYLTIWQWKG